ncbi:hypothetical protein C2845_PM08G02070 [Panicum miliaceum]|uniref:F-box domain-containing protein n=1 Tax=Panicum miliaceum TaxID=4540 RepID=A0A3L6R712_PANMI|nr:hypothetical protein C2845_PM08G02070 [Panicum miliaceum]
MAKAQLGLVLVAEPHVHRSFILTGLEHFINSRLAPRGVRWRRRKRSLREAAPLAVAPHLDDGVVSDILHRLPTKDAYGLTVVCPRWREIVSGPAFLSRHLSPRLVPLLDDRPYALILQPRSKIGYTHVTLVPTDPADSLALNLPLDPKYTSKSRDGLYSTGADDDAHVELDELPSGLAADEVRDIEALEDPDEPADGGAVSVDQSADADVPGEEAAPPLQVEAEDYAVFFERTVPLLDISFVASHGRLQLGRSRTSYYVCDPAANRWLALPPPPIPPTRDTASGLHYDLDAATGRVSVRGNMDYDLNLTGF